MCVFNMDHTVQYFSLFLQKRTIEFRIFLMKIIIFLLIISEFKEHEPWETIEYDRNGVVVGKVVDGIQTIKNSSQITPKLEVDEI